ncbi:MAG TPA: hypothetical protein VI298_07105 [Geobacteraceae bacterium]
MPGKNKSVNFIWPKMDDKESAVKAIYIGGAAAIINALLLLTFVAFHKLSSMSIVTAVIYVLIGFFIYKRSRVAAVLGALMCAINIVFYFIATRKFPDFYPILMIFFIAGVRGTFVYHRFNGKGETLDDASAPSEFDIR